ncbi:MAG TPA: FKBP-type peptidyl-prolyl cis-trans isomerase [Polyangiaceae bacterium]|nr:FKBP-type peptidyl-prolyl cis-trans isomerase [Polyangiaceae bacterium]
MAFLLALAVPLSACGSSDDEPDGDDAADSAMSVGRLSLDAPEDVAAAPSDAEVTSSGLASKVIEAGTGTRHPFPSDTVRVNYAGWQTDGMLFDASRRGPAEFPLGGVIRGWTEGLQLMVEGEVRRFWIPSELAYGDNPMGRNGRPPPPAGELVFDVELLAIVAP